MSKRHCGVFINLEQLSILGTSALTPKKRDKYVNEKIRMLTKDFKISVSDEEKEHSYSLETKAAIDRACRKIIKNRL